MPLGALGSVDSKLEPPKGLVASLQVEPQTVRRIAMPTNPSATCRIGLDEIRQRDPQLDIESSHGRELRTRPWESMKIHVARLYGRTIPAEGQQGVLDDQSRIIGGAEKRSRQI